MCTVPIIGLPLAATTYAGAVEWVLEQAVSADRAFAVEAANTHVAALSRHDPEFGETMSRFDLIVPDGMPLVWAINMRLPEGQKLTDRVYGPTLMLETLKATQSRPEFRHFLLGGRDSTLEKLTGSFADRFPGAVIADVYSPPLGEWPEDESERIAAKIRESGANLIWVGMGCPKQEHWIAKHKNRLPPGVIRIPCGRGETIATVPAKDRHGVGLPRGHGTAPPFQTLLHLQLSVCLPPHP